MKYAKTPTAQRTGLPGIPSIACVSYQLINALRGADTIKKVDVRYRVLLKVEYERRSFPSATVPLGRNLGGSDTMR